MTNIQLMALLGMSALKTRSELDPFDYQGLGINWYVDTMIPRPVECLKVLMKRLTGRVWNGKDPLWGFLVDQLREDALIARVYRQFGHVERVDKNYRYVQAYELMTNMDHHHSDRAHQEYEKARLFLMSFIEEAMKMEQAVKAIEEKPESGVAL